jgi:hypothetical protein
MSRLGFARPPRVLFVASWDTEDIGVQRVFDGFVDICGAENVIPWPHNPYLHRHASAPVFHDSDCNVPEKFLHEWQVVSLLRRRIIDLVVLSSERLIAEATAYTFRYWLELAQTGVVVLDCEDTTDLRVKGLFEKASEGLRRSLICIGKRELMSPMTFEVPGQERHVPVIPCPFSYPERLMVPPSDKPPDGPLVFYRAHDWGWELDSPRHKMVHALREAFGERADANLSSEKHRTGRLSPEEYRTRMRSAKIAVAVNEKGGSDNNRYWEAVAAGCVLVSDHPRHIIPRNFVDKEEAFFYTTPEEAVEIIRELDSNPDVRRAVAEAGQAKMRAAHTTRARVMQILGAVVEIQYRKGIDVGWAEVDHDVAQ